MAAKYYWVAPRAIWSDEQHKDSQRSMQRVVLSTDYDKLQDELEGVRTINRLQAEALAEERANNREWLAANAPGGWIDDLRKASARSGEANDGR